MMINNNFFSMIVLGKFNPGILNKDFLINNKIYFDNEKLLEDKYAPILSMMNFEKIKIIMDLERLQVTEDGLDDFKKNRVVKFVDDYLNILKYTPIKISGVNFNIDVQIKTKEIINLINTKKILNIFKVDNILVDINNKIHKKLDNEILSIRIKAFLDNNHVVQLGFNKKRDDIYNLNYNYEIGDLDKNPEKRQYFVKKFNLIHKEYKDKLKNLIGD